MTKKTTIGELIENEVRRQQIPITHFAELICCNRNNVYDIFQRNKMDIVQLKLISEKLNRNFFKELAEDVDLISDSEENENEILKRKVISQFFEVVPEVLRKLGKSSVITFGYIMEDIPVPDYCLPDYFITFTIGETLKERMNGYNSPILMPIDTKINDNGIAVDVLINKLYGSMMINIKLDYKSEEEWYQILQFAFEIYSQYRR
ncbi:MAG: hypothetical protein LBM07_05265 [Culturomica sp.]|jgi:hypothetical protein|nr:hypothetical protein [Culturomica sp.]